MHIKILFWCTHTIIQIFEGVIALENHKVISIRVTNSECSSIKTNALKNDQNMSEYIKDMVFKSRMNKKTATQIILHLSNIETILNNIEPSNDTINDYQTIRQEVTKIWRILK